MPKVARYPTFYDTNARPTTPTNELIFEPAWEKYIKECGIDTYREPSGRVYAGSRWYDMECSTPDRYQVIRFECDNPNSSQVDRITLFNPPIGFEGYHLMGRIEVCLSSGDILGLGSISPGTYGTDQPPFDDESQISMVDHTGKEHRFQLYLSEISTLKPDAHGGILYVPQIQSKGLIPLSLS